MLNDLARASKSYWGYTQAQIDLWADDLTVSDEQLASGRVVCAEVSGDVVGFFALTHDDDAAELDHLWVTPDFIGRGVGRALFERAIEMAQQEGHCRLRIVSEPNARGFYTRMGAALSANTLRLRQEGCSRFSRSTLAPGPVGLTAAETDAHEARPT